MHQESIGAACISVRQYDAKDEQVVPELGMRGRAACRTPQELVSNVSIICRRSLFTVSPTTWFPAAQLHVHYSTCHVKVATPWPLVSDT